MATDYDRACDIEGYLGLLGVGTGQALVLGEEPYATAWQTGTTGGETWGGMLIRWEYAESDAAAQDAIAHASELPWKDDKLALTVGHEPLYLIDSSCPGAALEARDHLTISLPTGTYTIATSLYKPDSKTSLILHRFTRQ